MKLDRNSALVFSECFNAEDRRSSACYIAPRPCIDTVGSIVLDMQAYGTWETRVPSIAVVFVESSRLASE